MAIIKCKMCGGDLTVIEGASVAECEYCGTRQTVPSVDNEKKAGLFLRAEKLRRDCDFDRATAIYDSIITDFPAEPEAYWGLLLCKYGIEYVDDPATGKKVPTCHRSSFESVMEDENLEKVMDCADVAARKIYRDEAKAIEEIRKGIVEISGKEPPYDIFICYKETDETGSRTIDSVLAQDVYDALTAKGYRVFFSRITLEDKLGTEYEPYIFAALNSAKVMLVFGTDYEYFNAVWVKNEWSRFLKLMAQDKGKHLIPCYKDVDAYDMPKEFQRLQAQDLGKVGAVQDLLRGIDKLLKSGEAQAVPAAAPQAIAGGPTADSLLKRGQTFLEEGNWNSAGEYFNKVLDLNPECAEAYLGLFCTEHKYQTADQIAENSRSLSASYNKDKALRYASSALRSKLEDWLQIAEGKKQQEEKQREQLRPLSHTLLTAKYSHVIGLRSDGTVMATGHNKFGECNVSDWRDIVAVSAGSHHTVGLRTDGTVVAAGNNSSGECNVSDWQDIVAISAGHSHTVGLRADGTVVATLYDLSVSDWRDIVAVSAGWNYTVGLRVDGTVVVKDAKNPCPYNVSDWRSIVAIYAGEHHTVGLRADGTVVATGFNNDGECNVSDWRDIVSISVGGNHTVGLRADGTVVATGYNDDGQCNVSKWQDIVAISAGWDHTVGLRADGTIVAANNSLSYSLASYWQNIVAVCSGVDFTVGLQTDGTVVAAGSNQYNECEVTDWQLFSSAEDLDNLKEKQETRRRRGEEARQAIARLRKERIATLKLEFVSLQTELSNLKGLFTGKRRKEIEARLTEIEAELRRL